MFTWFFPRKTPKTIPPKQTSQASALPKVSQERRRRSDVPYALPKDLEEGQRLNLQHYIFRYALRGNYVAPLPATISAILDVGSGTGIWGQEMAQLFPSSRVFGFDLESPQSVSLAASANSAPENFHFVQGNLFKGLPFPDGMFDYTHQRALVGGIPLQNWPEAIREMVRVTRPGGWVELLEMGSDIYPAGPATMLFSAWVLNFLKARGFDPSQMQHIGKMLSQGGLRSVSSHTIDIPLGSWNRHLGVLMEKDIIAAYRTVKPFLSQNEGVSQERIENCVQEMTQEWKRQKAVYRVYIAYGQV